MTLGRPRSAAPEVDGVAVDQTAWSHEGVSGPRWLGHSQCWGSPNRGMMMSRSVICSSGWPQHGAPPKQTKLAHSQAAVRQFLDAHGAFSWIASSSLLRGSQSHQECLIMIPWFQSAVKQQKQKQHKKIENVHTVSPPPSHQWLAASVPLCECVLRCVSLCVCVSPVCAWWLLAVRDHASCVSFRVCMCACLCRDWQGGVGGA